MMAKRINDFFSPVPKKSPRDIHDSIQIHKCSNDENHETTMTNLSASCSHSSSNGDSGNSIDRDEITITQAKSKKKCKQLNTKDDSDSHCNGMETAGSDSISKKRAEWYKGSKLDINWLLQTYPCLQKVRLGKRFGIKCNICFTHIQEAQKFSKNGKIPIADGVRCDSSMALQRIVDHIKTGAHTAADNLEKMQEKWMTQSDQHPWIKTLKACNAEKVKLLIELAVDVYNDSRQLTLSAHSWPSRSLSKIHADTQISSYKDDGLASQFTHFEPSAALLQYRTPIIYREMLDIVGKCVMENITDKLKKTDCFSIQIDGSIDKYGIDNKFITARFMTENKELTSVFLGESKSSKRGAEGLLESIKIVLEDLNILSIAKEKLTGLTTDGESANTGRRSGLWVRMKTYLEKDILCFWCIAHRSDLALSDLEASVMEVAHWKSNVKAVATFYRGSAVRYEEFEKICTEENATAYRFPAYFEVRFAEHLLNLSTAVWKNLPYMQKHWKSIIGGFQTTKTEKATAQGFLRKWEDGGKQQKLTCLMMDLLRHIQKLQKDGQKSRIVLTDIEISKKIALDAITLMESGPYPGAYEEKLFKSYATEDNENGSKQKPDDVEVSKRRVVNTLVSNKRCWSAVRSEVVSSCKEFLSQRLDEDQKGFIDRMNKFVHGRSSKEIIQAIRIDIESLFGEHLMSSFTDDVISLYAAEKLPPPLEMDSSTAKLYYYLKVSTPGSIFSKIVQTYICITPHSAGPERAVSVHTTLKSNKQSSYSREAINSRMYIALNGEGTALYDPRPAVAKFLEAKERRRKLPDCELYQNHEYVKNFFSKNTNL